jgi:hypothetical protein
MDGAAHLVRMLLSVERLRQRAAAMVSPLEATTGSTSQDAGAPLLEAIHRCAASAKDPVDAAWLEEQWVKDEEQCRRFVELILTPRPAVPRRPDMDLAPSTPDSAARDQELLESCARAIIRSIQTRILREDLSALAEAIRGEGDDCADTSQAWLASHDASLTAGTLGTEQPWVLWEQAEQVGKERLRGEVGSDTFAGTAAHAATVAASTVGTPTKPKVVVTALSALRGYTLALWAMVTLLTRKSHLGPRVVQLAVAAGGVFLAAAIFVPAMPLGFTLAGVLLLLAGVSAGALLTEEAQGVGLRLGICALAAAALGGYVYWELDRQRVQRGPVGPADQGWDRRAGRVRGLVHRPGPSTGDPAGPSGWPVGREERRCGRWSGGRPPGRGQCGRRRRPHRRPPSG